MFIPQLTWEHFRCYIQVLNRRYKNGMDGQTDVCLCVPYFGKSSSSFGLTQYESLLSVSWQQIALLKRKQRTGERGETPLGSASSVRVITSKMKELAEHKKLILTLLRNKICLFHILSLSAWKMLGMVWVCASCEEVEQNARAFK